jgi:hypothetical protein
LEKETGREGEEQEKVEKDRNWNIVPKRRRTKVPGPSLLPKKKKSLFYDNLSASK